MWPALPVTPVWIAPSRTSPPPTPVETTMPSMARVVYPPRQYSPSAMQWPSPASSTGRPGSTGRSASTIGYGRQSTMLTGLTVPASRSSGPAEPMPSPTSRLAGPLAATSRASRSSAAPALPPSAGVATVARSRIVPSGSTMAAASFVPPTSTARTGPLIGRGRR
jgi:hypothetical protein